MTTVTLRKANAFERALLEQSKKFAFKRTIEASIHNDTPISEQVVAAQTTLKSNLTTAVALVRASHQIRAAISRQNADSGINALLSEKAALDAEEKLISSVVTGVAPSRRGGGDDYEFEQASEIATAQKQLENLRVRVASPNGYHVEAVSVRILDATAIEQLSDDLAAIRRRKTQLADELLELNTSAKVSISSEAEDLLRQFKLI